MKNINPKKRELELEFWRGWYAHHNPLEITLNIWNQRINRFPELNNLPEGSKGIDLGCGPISIFEFHKNVGKLDILAIDPLHDEFGKFAPRAYNVKYAYADGEYTNLDSESFDWIGCFNVIDHTPNPLRMLAEIFRLLKKDSLFFFEVFFEDTQTPPHYQLWREDKVNWVREIFNEIRFNVEREDVLKRNVFTGVYKK